MADPVRATIEAGAVGANLEDGRAEAQLRSVEDMVARLTAAREAADSTGRPFHLNARTDIWLLPVGTPLAGDTQEALRRLRAYREAGADSAFVSGLGLGPDLDRIVREQDLPLNVLRAAPDDPTTAALAAAGVARISHGPGPWRQAMAAVTEFARAAAPS